MLLIICFLCFQEQGSTVPILETERNLQKMSESATHLEYVIQHINRIDKDDEDNTGHCRIGNGLSSIERMRRKSKQELRNVRSH